MIKPYAPAGIPRKTAVALRPATHYPQMVLLYGVYQRQHGPHFDCTIGRIRPVLGRTWTFRSLHVAGHHRRASRSSARTARRRRRVPV